MSVAGTIIIVNSNNYQKATEIVKAIRDLEQDKAYFHVGFSVLKEHFITQNNLDLTLYLKALYGALSGTARCGIDIVSDLHITTQTEYQELAPFISDLDIVWINLDLDTNFVKPNLSFSEETKTEEIAKSILLYLKQRYKHALAYSRWASEVSPVPQARTLGKIVLLHGASSAGKSTLSRAVQQLSPEIFLHVGIDTAVLYYAHLRYLNGVPENETDQSWKKPNYTPTKFHKLGISWIAPGPNEENPYPYLRMQIGTVGRQSVSAMYATMAEMSRLGFNVISDHCFHYPNALAEAQHRFSGLPVTYVKLCPSLETIKRREQERGDRMTGMGESVYYQMLSDFPADIELDTGVHSPEEGARAVLNLLNKKYSN